jgi:hypothetical protein
MKPCVTHARGPRAEDTLLAWVVGACHYTTADVRVTHTHSAHALRERWAKHRARSHCRFVLPLIRFIPDSRTYPVPLFLKPQYDRPLVEHTWVHV